MSTYVHFAILVTDSHKKVAAAHPEVAKLLKKHHDPDVEAELQILTPVFRSVVGDFGSFAVLPDGSSYGGELSDYAAKARKKIIGYLRDTSVGFAVVQYGLDCNKPKMLEYSEDYLLDD